MRIVKTLAAGFAFAILAANNASAAVITFEGQTNTIYNAPIVRLGYEIGNPVGDEQHFHEITSTGFGLPNNGTGVLLNDRDTEIYMRDVLLSTFTLGNFDVASALNNQPAASILITGYLGLAPTGSIGTALGAGYTTLNGAVLGVVDRLVFDGIGGQGGFVLDNVELNPAAPEPASMLLLGLGAAAAAVRRRRA